MEFVEYISQEATLPVDGQKIIAYHDSDNVVVYQAYKQEIADYAIKYQQLGGPDFSLERMSWIKPNFLWMMYRSGWATKSYQERILAIYIKKSTFDKIISLGVPSHFDDKRYETREIWAEQLKKSDVRIQWDPDHYPSGKKHPKRRVIQLGLRGDILKSFCKEWIVRIEDMTDFVISQRGKENPLVPKESCIEKIEL
ncbi:MAG: DUF4291 domain-containing protein [Hyperionvirus sp.]|uniref:DUF4291 domain-containing protein n=1 Tax=Hyperionvirus sp. TaxID=2487770 RepID=A0A3G5ABH2_9VIRU|nr:MAG: DUF4291 domain-containing protein [Hyperionvirus sp.]